MDATIERSNSSSHLDRRHDVRTASNGATSHCRRLLVCLDGSAFSSLCGPHAIALAHTFGSEVTLAHVMAPVSTGSHDAVGWEILRQESHSYLERKQADISRELGRPVGLRLEQGRPAERIASLAHDIGADMIVVGSRGEGGAAPGTLGSTVLGVLASAKTSILLAHPMPGNVWAPPSRILLPLDGSLRSESVLPFAARLAATHNAELLLVHVVQDPLASAIVAAPEGIDLARRLAGSLEAGAEQYLGRLKRQLEHQLPSVRTLVVRRASQHQCLLELSWKQGVDLVVLSAHGSACDTGRSFGSVTACLMAQATVPVLALQDLGEADLGRGVGTMEAAPGLAQGHVLRAAESA